jgi:hypothetical protein
MAASKNARWLFICIVVLVFGAFKYHLLFFIHFAVSTFTAHAKRSSDDDDDEDSLPKVAKSVKSKTASKTDDETVERCVV